MTEEKRQEILRLCEILEKHLDQNYRKKYKLPNPDVDIDSIDILYGGFSLLSGASLVNLFVDD